MNYLAHAYLSFGDSEILTGNLIADHVKGKLALDKYPEKIKQGIILHRRIDEYTDQHPATKRASIYFKPKYGLYANPIIDCLYDHYLANDPKLFTSEAELLKYTQETYNKALLQVAYFPEKFASYFPHMREHNWLYNYRTMPGIKRSLVGLNRRAIHMPDSQDAYETFVTHYYILAQCYYEFIDDVIKFVKIELSK